MNRRDDLIATALTREQWMDQDDSKADGVKPAAPLKLPEPYRRRSEILEAQVLRETLSVLRLLKIWHRRIQVQGTIQHTGNGSAVMRSSTMTGLPDVLGCLPQGRLLAIEVKASGGSVSLIQIDTLQELQKSGAKVCVLVEPKKLRDWLSSAHWELKLEGIDVV
jgi:hypothetical protein